MMILNDMNDTEDAHGEVTLMKLRVGVNRLGRPKTYFLCFWCKLMMSSELLWKSSAVSGTFPKGEVDIEAVYAVWNEGGSTRAYGAFPVSQGAHLKYAIQTEIKLVFRLSS